MGDQAGRRPTDPAHTAQDSAELFAATGLDPTVPRTAAMQAGSFDNGYFKKHHASTI